jgi:hypothetical protein
LLSESERLGPRPLHPHMSIDVEPLARQRAYI